MLYLLLTALYGAFLSIWNFLNTDFGVSLLSGLIGAYFGVLFAYKVIAKQDHVRLLVNRIQSINAAIAVASFVANSLGPLRRDSTMPLVRAYEITYSAMNTFAAERADGKLPSNAIFEFTGDLSSLTVPYISAEKLEDLLLNKSQSHGRPLALCAALGQQLAAVVDLIKRRNEFISEMKRHDKARLAQLYFGTPDEDGNVDRTYQDLVRNLDRSTGEALWYAKTITEDLMLQAEKLALALGDDAPNVSSADFSDLVDAGLIPPDSQFPTWTKNFIILPDKKPKNASLVLPLLALLILLGLSLYHLIEGANTYAL